MILSIYPSIKYMNKDIIYVQTLLLGFFFFFLMDKIAL